MRNAIDPVNSPAHYKSVADCQCGQAIACIDVAENFNFNLGNVIKYVWRADSKGNALEDLKKAAWYLNREIENRTAAV